MATLPDEVVWYILRRTLSPCWRAAAARVCRRWHSVSGAVPLGDRVPLCFVGARARQWRATFAWAACASGRKSLLRWLLDQRSGRVDVLMWCAAARHGRVGELCEVLLSFSASTGGPNNKHIGVILARTIGHPGADADIFSPVPLVVAQAVRGGWHSSLQVVLPWLRQSIRAFAAAHHAACKAGRLGVVEWLHAHASLDGKAVDFYRPALIERGRSTAMRYGHTHVERWLATKEMGGQETVQLIKADARTLSPNTDNVSVGAAAAAGVSGLASSSRRPPPPPPPPTDIWEAMARGDILAMVRLRHQGLRDELLEIGAEKRLIQALHIDCPFAVRGRAEWLVQLWTTRDAEHCHDTN